MSKQPFRLPDNSFRKVQAEKFDNEDDDENDEEALNQILEGKQHVSILNDHEINILINQYL